MAKSKECLACVNEDNLPQSLKKSKFWQIIFRIFFPR